MGGHEIRTEASKLFRKILLFPSFECESKGRAFSEIFMCSFSNGGNLWFSLQGIPGWGGMRRSRNISTDLTRDETPAACSTIDLLIV